MSVASRWLRWSFARSDAVRDAGLSTPDDVIRYDGIRYGKIPCGRRWTFTAPAAGRMKPSP